MLKPTYTFKSIYLDKSEMEVCRTLAKMRASANNSSNYNSDYYGLLGELAFAKHFNLYLDLSIGKRQNTYDFIRNDLRIDVKTNQRMDGSLIVKMKENIDVDIYALAVIDSDNENVIHLVGWIEKDTIRNENNLKDVTYADGSRDRKYMLSQEKLKRF